MVRINLNRAFEEMRRRSAFAEYQMVANNIIKTYDYNDIKKAIKNAKAQSTNAKNISFDEGIELMNNLFNNTIKWLKENARELS